MPIRIYLLAFLICFEGSSAQASRSFQPSEAEARARMQALVAMGEDPFVEFFIDRTLAWVDTSLEKAGGWSTGDYTLILYIEEKESLQTISVESGRLSQKKRETIKQDLEEPLQGLIRQDLWTRFRRDDESSIPNPNSLGFQLFVYKGDPDLPELRDDQPRVHCTFTVTDADLSE